MHYLVALIYTSSPLNPILSFLSGNFVLSKDETVHVQVYVTCIGPAGFPLLLRNPGLRKSFG